MKISLENTSKQISRINLEIIYLCLTFCPNAVTSAFFIKIVLTIYTHVTWHCVKYNFANYVFIYRQLAKGLS